MIPNLEWLQNENLINLFKGRLYLLAIVNTFIIADSWYKAKNNVFNEYSRGIKKYRILC
jgi:hypothetical protein